MMRDYGWFLVHDCDTDHSRMSKKLKFKVCDKCLLCIYLVAFFDANFILTLF